MQKVVFVCTYKGSAVPSNEKGTELKATTRGESIKALDGSQLPSGMGDGAKFESTVIVGDDGSFREHGTIDLGGGHGLQFSEISPGTMVPSPVGGSIGAIDWKVESGSGAFEGATGFITSNFSVGEDGSVTDHQLTSVVLR